MLLVFKAILGLLIISLIGGCIIWFIKDYGKKK